MLKGFKDFLMRGNVIDLAVAVVIGGAFAKIVDAFAKDFIGGLLAELGGAPNFDSVGFDKVIIGTTITALINFVIVAAAIYFMIVVPMTRLQALRRTAPEAADVPVPEDIALLTEIRDLLAQRTQA